jgi:hypothetical protein
MCEDQFASGSWRPRLEAFQGRRSKMTNHPNRSKISLEIGKTYLTRDGSLRVTIQAETDNRGTYRMQGEDELGRITWRSVNGRFERHAHSLDLVREAN